MKNNMNIETIKNKLNKIKALADKGYLNEANNAKKILEHLLEKYGITIDELDSKELKERKFKVPLAKQFIFIQVLAMIIGDRYKETCYKRNTRTIFYSEMSDYEYVQVKQLLDFHFTNYERERKKTIKNLEIAYLHKHNLFRQEKNKDDNKSKMSYEDAMRILNIIENLDEKYFMNQLNE